MALWSWLNSHFSTKKRFLDGARERANQLADISELNNEGLGASHLMRARICVYA